MTVIITFTNHKPISTSDHKHSRFHCVLVMWMHTFPEAKMFAQEKDTANDTLLKKSYKRRIKDCGWRMADGGWRLAVDGWRVASDQQEAEESRKELSQRIKTALKREQTEWESIIVLWRTEGGRESLPSQMVESGKWKTFSKTFNELHLSLPPNLIERSPGRKPNHWVARQGPGKRAGVIRCIWCWRKDLNSAPDLTSVVNNQKKLLETFILRWQKPVNWFLFCRGDSGEAMASCKVNVRR